MSAGKGDRYRPLDMEQYRKNWEKIFGVKKNGKTLESSAGEDILPQQTKGSSGESTEGEG